MTLQMGVTVQRRGSLTTCLLDCSSKLAGNLGKEDSPLLWLRKSRKV